MEQQLTGGGDAAGIDETAAQTEAALETETETPVLNRADRRAQAKGKKMGAAGPNLNPGVGRGASKPTGGHVGQVRFPRTGHK